MIRRVRAWLERVPIEDPVERRLSVTVQVLCIAGVAWGIAAVVAAAGRGIVSELTVPAAGIALVLAPSLLAALALLRAGRYRSGLRLALAGLVAFVALLHAEGLARGATYLRLVPIPLAVAALAFGRRALWGVLAVFAAVLGIAGLRDALFGAPLPPPAPEPLGIGLTALIGWSLLAVILDRFGVSLREALASAEARESERRTSEERARILFETSPDAINLSRADDGVYVEVNAAFTRVTGWAPSEALGRTSAELGLWADRARRQALLEALARSEPIDNVEAEFRRKDGTGVTGLLSSRFVTIHGQRYLLTVTRDITEHKRLQSERAALEEQLRQAQKLEAIGRLAGGVAHDFNNILTSILASADLLQREFPPGHPAGAEAEQIREDGLRAAELTRHLLAFARKQPVQPRVIRVEERALSIEKMLRRVLGEQIVLETAYAPDGWPVFIDPGQLEQVFLNLAVNARDAMPSGGRISVTTQNARVLGTTAGQPPPGDYLLLTVSDQGSGMVPEVLSHVFEPFYTTKGDRGTGLGLATCYGIVTGAGGAIAVESAPGAGTRFRIHLPRAAGVAATLDADQPRDLHGSETIVFVDDDASVRRLAVRSLVQLGYHVLDAGSAREAEQVAARHAGPIHLAVVDLLLPDGGGREAAARLLAGRPAVPVLYVSGWGPGDGAADPFLAKPFAPIDLARRVRTMLDAALAAAGARGPAPG